MSERHRDRGRHRRHTRSASQPVFAVGAMAAAFVPLVQSAGADSSSSPASLDSTAAFSTQLVAAPASAPTPEMVTAATEMLKVQAASTPSLRDTTAPTGASVLTSDNRASRSTTRSAATGAKAPTVTTTKASTPAATSATAKAPNRGGIKGVAELPIRLKDTPITSGFGWRTLNGETEYHAGIDWGVPMNTNVRAVQDGKVVYASWMNGYGYRVTLLHDDGSYSSYSHLNEIKVSLGQLVKMGSVIALSGASGVGTGAHLHFEIYQGPSDIGWAVNRPNNGWQNPVDWFRNRGITDLTP